MNYHPKSVKGALKNGPKIFSQMLVENGGRLYMNYRPSFFHSRGRLLRKLPNPSQCEKWSGAKKKHVVACLGVHTNLWNLHQKLVLQIGRNWPSKKLAILLKPNLLEFLEGFLLAVRFREGCVTNALGDTWDCRWLDPINLVKLYSIWVSSSIIQLKQPLVEWLALGYQVNVNDILTASKPVQLLKIDRPTLAWKLTCPLKINGWKMYSLLKLSLFTGHVSFRGRILFFASPTTISYRNHHFFKEGFTVSSLNKNRNLFFWMVVNCQGVYLAQKKKFPKTLFPPQDRTVEYASLDRPKKTSTRMTWTSPWKSKKIKQNCGKYFKRYTWQFFVFFWIVDFESPIIYLEPKWPLFCVGGAKAKNR